MANPGALDMSRHSEVAASGFSATAAAAQAYDSRRWVNSLVFEAWQLPQKRQAFMPSPSNAAGMAAWTYAPCW